MKNVPKIRLKRFEGEWTSYYMANVISDLYNGQTPYRGESKYWNGDINWISSGDLNRNIVNKSSEKITKEGQCSANLRLVPHGTFVIAITGLEAAGTRGNCGILGIDTTMNQSCMAIFPLPKILDTSFLFQWYKSCSEELGIRMTQGTKQQSYNASIINKIRITIPDIEEQIAIGNFFQNLDNLLTEQKDKLENFQKVKKSMLCKMFPKEGQKVPEIRFKGFDGDWEEKKLGDIGNTFTGLSGKDKSDFGHGKGRYITYMNVFSNPIASLNQIENIEIDNSQCKVKYGDVFFTTSSETPEEVGMSSVWLRELDNVYLNSFCFGYRLLVHVDSYFMAYYLRSSYFRRKITFLAQGISRFNISKNKVMKIEFFLPPTEEQQLIGNYFKSLDELIKNNQDALENLRHFKQSCLQKMFA